MKSADSFFASLLSNARHLVVTAVLPGIVLIFSIYFAVASCGFTTDPSAGQLTKRLSAIGGSEIGLFFLGATVGGLLLRPLQFAVIQFLEGYWGSGCLGVWASSRLRLNAVRRSKDLYRQAYAETPEEAWQAGLRDAVARFDPHGCFELVRRRPPPTKSPDDQVRREEAIRLLSKQPARQDRLMPTRLGNALRRGEDAAGSPFGLEVAPLTGHFFAVSDTKLVAYADGTRTQLDASASLCLVFSLITAIFTAAFIDDGWWMAYSLLAFILAWVAYLGAIVAAHDFMQALHLMVDLHRFDLYAALRVAPPQTLREERLEVGPHVSRVFGARKRADALRFVAATQEALSQSIGP